MSEYKVETITLNDNDFYGNQTIENNLESYTSEGFVPIHISSHFEPIQKEWKIFIMCKRTPLAKAIFND